MSARDEIFKRLAGAFIAEDRANALIDAYAHELAEKQRKHIGPEGPGGGCHHGVCCGDELADLIDPEARLERRHCGMEQAHTDHEWIQNGVWYLCSTVVLN